MSGVTCERVFVQVSVGMYEECFGGVVTSGFELTVHFQQSSPQSRKIQAAPELQALPCTRYIRTVKIEVIDLITRGDKVVV